MIVEFTSSTILLHPSSPHSWNSFNRSHFSIYVYKYIIFPLYHPPIPFPYIPSTQTGTNPKTGLVLPSCYPKKPFLISYWNTTYILRSEQIECLWLEHTFITRLRNYHQDPSPFVPIVLIPPTSILTSNTIH
jgi:hypothetical protein